MIKEFGYVRVGALCPELKVGTISVSPRGDLRMPSDADNSIWLEI